MAQASFTLKVLHVTADGCNAEAMLALTAREVCQVLREIVFGRQTMTKLCSQTWDEVYASHFIVDVEGWRITRYNDCDELDYCEECTSPDGRQWSFGISDRMGTDPVTLLST